MKDVAYYFTKEVARRINIPVTDLYPLGRLMKVKKIFGTYVWFEKDIAKVERLIK